MAETFSCADCGADFELPASVRERYPDWTPRRCRRCHGGPRRSGAADRDGPRRRPRAKARPLEAGSGFDEDPALARVLDRYQDGPETGVFTDGSASPNPGPGGWGAVHVEDGVILGQASGEEAPTTNNRMELTALIEGCRLVPEGQATTLYSDSELCVRTVNEWAAGWERRGWKRRSGPIKNLDLVQELWGLARERPELTFQWTRGHAGWRWNEYADALATAHLRRRKRR